MIGYRVKDDGYITVEIELDKDGNPILDDESTIEDPSFEHREGFRQTIKKGKWVWVESHNGSIDDIEDYRKEAIFNFYNWEPKYLNAPFVSMEDVYNGDSTFREMLNSSIMANREWGVLPDFWFTATEKLIAPITRDFLDQIGKDSYNCYQDKLKISLGLLGQIKTTDDLDFLKYLKFPEVPTVESLLLQVEQNKAK